MRMLRQTVVLSLLAAIGLTGSADAALLRGNLGAARGSATKVARATLARYAQRLGVDATSFRFTSVRHSQIGTHVRGYEVVDGVRVDGSAAIVNIVGGRVVWVGADQVRTSARPVARPGARWCPSGPRRDLGRGGRRN
jgi:hypothetical protein